jgi:hypothetical protein
MPQTGNIISGLVKDPGGRPVPLARVYFTESPVPLPDIAALTNDNGEFSLSVPIAGRYKIACAAEGFQSTVTEVTVKKGKMAKIQIRMKK